MAVYLAFETLVLAGLTSDSEVTQYQLNASIFTGEASQPLQDLESQPAPIWPGHIGYLAVQWLVSNSDAGLMSLRVICEEVAAERSLADAFVVAFGIQKSEFYKLSLDDLVVGGSQAGDSD